MGEKVNHDGEPARELQKRTMGALSAVEKVQSLLLLRIVLGSVKVGIVRVALSMACQASGTASNATIS